MSATVKRTEAEETLSRQFKATAHLLPGGGWIADARARAMRAFETSGLPHRRIEAWKYTDLRENLRTAYPPAGCAASRPDAATLASLLGEGLAALPCIRLILVNGRFVAIETPAGHEAGAGVEAGALSAALGQPDTAWIESRFTNEMPDGVDPLMALNAAFVADGVVLRVGPGAQPALPFHIVSIVAADGPTAVATRNLIRVEAGASAIIIESHLELGGQASQVTSVTQVDVGAGAELRHLKHVGASAQSAHLCRWDVDVAADATYRGFQLTAGAGLLRNDSTVRFNGPDAKFDLSGLMLGRDRDHIDTTMVLHHIEPGCESRELFKTVLDDAARAVFQAKVIVDPQAQKTDGKQMAQALLLSPDTEFDSKPELEIYADDVVCGHGATVAELDAGMLFYLRSRGIPEPQARAMLIESFTAEAIEKIDDERIREAFRAMAIDWLRARS